MKNSLKFKIAIIYYRTKIKIAAFLSSQKSAAIAFELFCTPYTRNIKIQEPLVFSKGETLEFLHNNIIVRGWRWKPLQSMNKKVLIVHGFSSCSYKFAVYVELLLKQNFEVIAFDAPAHGISDGKTINALIFKDLVIEIHKKFGDLNAIIAHSLGGLAASLAAEEMYNLKKLVLIAPVVETENAIQNFFSMFSISPKTQTAFRDLLQKIAKNSISYFSTKNAIPKVKAKIMWVHDMEDEICPYKDVIPIQKNNSNNIYFHITKGLGHSNVYKNDEVVQTIISFIAND